MNDTRVLDYSKCVREIPYRTQAQYIDYENKRAFFEQQGICPYCREKITRKHLSSYDEIISEDDPTLNYFHSLWLWVCNNCGWWEMNHHERTGRDSIDPAFVTDYLYLGVLRTYDITDNDVPIETLRKVIKSKADSIHLVDPGLMEQLVSSVLTDFFPGCKATVCGKTGDGGIDIIFVEADVTFAVQVKRKARYNSVETVQSIREFLGASLLKGYDHLMYVSTAGHFTKGAVSSAEDAMQRRLVQRFELIDRSRFLNMLGLITNKHEEPWRKFVPAEFEMSA